MSIDKYRFDRRTKEEFIHDIKKGNKREALSITLFRIYLRREFGFKGDIVPNGCDMTGDFIEDEEKVTTDADYLFGKNKLPLEVKTSAGHNTTIYMKVNQVDSYIKQGASVLYVNGIEGHKPAFTLWTVEDLKEMRDTLETTIPPNGILGGKLSYVIDARDYKWETFSGKEKVYV